MSNCLTVIANRSTNLHEFASSLITKATKNAVTVMIGEKVVNNSVIIGYSEPPPRVHTSVTNINGTGIYSGVNTVFVRSLLPNTMKHYATNNLPDKSSLHNECKETSEIIQKFEKTIKKAIEIAKVNNHKKIIVMLKHMTNYEKFNKLFSSTVSCHCEEVGIDIGHEMTHDLFSKLVMFPETIPVVLTNDTEASFLIERAFSGIAGGSPSVLYTDTEVFYCGYSSNSVASAVARALSAIGYSNEAKLIEKTLMSCKPDQDGKDLLAAL